jgi:hypothetical protein
VFINQCQDTCQTMDHKRKDYLGEAQHRDEILVVIEFDSPFPGFDIL